MLPDWIKKKDNYEPSQDSLNFIFKTTKSISSAITRIKIQNGRENKRSLPAGLKLFLLLAAIIFISTVRHPLAILAFTSIALLMLCMLEAKDIWQIIKIVFTSGILVSLLLLPSILLKQTVFYNNLLIVAKVMLSLTFVSIFNHTTQWNHITTSLRRFGIPGIFIFILDITLKYMVILGNTLSNLLTSLQLRSVGKNNKKYDSVGGIMGVTFTKSTEIGKQMYEAMQCRGFTDDYERFSQ